MARFPIPAVIKRFSAHFNEAGYSLYIVGGAVRDHLLGLEIQDYDFATDARPQEVMALFRRVVPTGIEHGTVSVHYEGNLFEVTTFRSDGAYHDGRHPSSVSFDVSLEEDLKRRDFTINAFAVEATSGVLHDLNGGISDLSEHLIRAIGDPLQRFDEDGLRILRACRISAKLDFTIEEKTLEAMRLKRENLLLVSAERIREELFRLIGGPYPMRGLHYLTVTGVLTIILPELAQADGVQQGGRHHEDVLDHSFTTFRIAATLTDSLETRLAALLHDVGKSETVEYGAERNTFIGHEIVGSKIAATILRRLKASNKEIETISHLVRHHMFNYDSSWSDSAVRRFIRRVGLEHLNSLFIIRLADQAAISGLLDTTLLDELRARIDGIVAAQDALGIADLAIDGNEVIALGAERGPMVGAVLSYLLETVLDDPKQNTKEQLLTIAMRYVERISTS
jgi:tRNA nucleotidyltransferase (CCA-adding enzyme)